jgi:hypothetical protein
MGVGFNGVLLNMLAKWQRCFSALAEPLVKVGSIAPLLSVPFLLIFFGTI